MPFMQHPDPSVSPWKIGLIAARRNLVPGLILQFASLCLLGAYYYWPAVPQVLEPVARWQKEWGIGAAFLNRAFFSNILPALFLVLFPRLRPSNLPMMVLIGIFYYGGMGVTTSLFYGLQSKLYGDTHAPLVLFLKTMTDQFVYTLFFASPTAALYNFWAVNGFSISRTRAALPENLIRGLFLPNLIPNWALWIPGCAIVYMLPPLLQIHFSGLIACFWTLLCLQVAANSSKPEKA